jgi:hypothetical protein
VDQGGVHTIVKIKWKSISKSYTAAPRALHGSNRPR